MCVLVRGSTHAHHGRIQPAAPDAFGAREDGLTPSDLGIRIGMMFAKRTPTHRELAAHFPMSRANAYRWVQRLRAAKGEA